MPCTILLSNQGSNEVIDAQLKMRRRDLLLGGEIRDLSSQLQIFRLGLVLAELILGIPISGINKGHDAHELLIELPQRMFMTASQIGARVHLETTSQTLGNLVQFCLSSTAVSKQTQDTFIDERYYDEALVP
jgi:hypothetical protein